MILRDYKKDDYPEIIKLWENTGVGSKKRGDNKDIIEQSIYMGGKFIVVESDGQIVGSSWITFDGRRLHLHHVAVLPSYQNRGIGKRLTQASIEFARHKGYQIKLEVHKTNKKAIEIYKKLGFSYLGDYNIYIIRDM